MTFVKKVTLRVVVPLLCTLIVAIIAVVTAFGRENLDPASLDGLRLFFTSLPPHEFPLFVAPLFTMFVSSSSGMKYVFSVQQAKGEGVMVVCFVGTLATAVVCVLLAVSSSWNWHMGFLAILFAVFLLWDVVLAWVGREVLDDEAKADIRDGHVIVNIPSLVAIGIASWILCGFDVPVPEMSEAHHQPDYRDVFASGLVSFHLAVAAVAYLASTVLGKKRRVWWMPE
ncbi:MAG: hypothetical protein ACQGVC_04170 [Myxococcota bacterium]